MIDPINPFLSALYHIYLETPLPYKNLLGLSAVAMVCLFLAKNIRSL